MYFFICFRNNILFGLQYQHTLVNNPSRAKSIKFTLKLPKKVVSNLLSKLYHCMHQKVLPQVLNTLTLRLKLNIYIIHNMI